MTASQAEMRDDLRDQPPLLGVQILLLVYAGRADRTERPSAHVDLALLADHDHHAVRIDAFFRLLQHDAVAVEARAYAAVFQLFRRRDVGVEKLLEEGAGGLPAGTPFGVVLGPSRLEFR